MTRVWTGKLLTPHRTDLQPNHAARHMQRKIQPVRARAKSLIDDRRRQHHAHAGGAKVMRAAEKNQ